MFIFIFYISINFKYSSVLWFLDCKIRPEQSLYSGIYSFVMCETITALISGAVVRKTNGLIMEV